MIPKSVQAFMQMITDRYGSEHPEWVAVFNKCYANTLETTVKKLDDGSIFLLTGDIPAMWLRDSTAQIRPYLVLAKDNPEIQDLIKGVLTCQLRSIALDPYANAFNAEANGQGHQTDQTEMNDWIWERKYEIDSLCYPLQLAYLYYLATEDATVFDSDFILAVDKVLEVWETEQNHAKSPYRFMRDTWRAEDTLINDGKGPECAVIGMTWSGFRPSDDACIYNYLVPSNQFAVLVLSYLADVFDLILPNEQTLARVISLKVAIEAGIQAFALVKNQAGQEIYAYEVDGLGHATIMDDANIPNLMSLPYLGYCEVEDEIYQNTRATLLSTENPYYYQGKYAAGNGSSHTPENYVWPIALAMQGLTTPDKAEKAEILEMLVATSAGTNLMHEGFDVDNPANYTRDWFSWANMMFCELMLDYFDIRIKIKKAI
ncbi:glycoside hydrolase family 125 protein [Pseudolactococcus yaeyamensis]